MGQWFIGKPRLTEKLINEKLPFKTPFHYSTIPLFQVQGKNSSLKKFF
jgi:hypothetical protein